MHTALPHDAIDRSIPLAQLMQRAAQRRFTEEQVEEMVHVYTDNGVLLEDNGRLIFAAAD